MMNEGMREMNLNEHVTKLGTRSRPKRELVQVRECLALMAEGQGEDPKIYQEMAAAALKIIDQSGDVMFKPLYPERDIYAK